MIVPCISISKYIIGIPFVTTIYTISFLVHLKRKYHNVHEKPVKISINLSRANKINKALQYYQKEVKIRILM